MLAVLFSRRSEFESLIFFGRTAFRQAGMAADTAPLRYRHYHTREDTFARSISIGSNNVWRASSRF
jgi:hypothetical protein